MMENLTLVSTNYLTEVSQSRAASFGELVKLAIPHIKHYHSDLFHDAVWLENNMSGESFAFYWSVSDTGTSIGTEPIGLREHAYRVTVSCIDGIVRMSADEYRPTS